MSFCVAIFEIGSMCSRLIIAFPSIVIPHARNTDDVKNTAWTTGESGDFKIWIGLNKVNVNESHETLR